MNQIEAMYECPCCRKKIKSLGCGNRMMPVEENSLELLVGGSCGGWGRRFDTIRFSGEVCNECFLKVLKYTDGLREILGIPQRTEGWDRIKRWFNLKVI